MPRKNPSVSEESESDALISMEVAESKKGIVSIKQPTKISFDQSVRSHLVEKTDDCEYDLGHLCSYDGTHLDANAVTNMSYLDALNRDNAQLLINRLYALQCEPHPILPTQKLSLLPKPIMTLPREKPVPKGKVLTKWEQFAKLKGIKKQSKSRMVFDEERQEYAPRFGHKRANDPSRAWVLEHKDTPGDHPSIDPFTKLAQEKRQRVEKNKAQQAHNLLRAAAPGSRLPGAIDLSAAKKNASGDAPGKRNALGKRKEMHHVDVALDVAQHATASMGKFDKVRSKTDAPRLIKKQRTSNDVKKTLNEEKNSALGIFNRIMGKSTEKTTFDVNSAARAESGAKIERVKKGKK